MKTIYCLTACLITNINALAQNVFWIEDFGTGCNQGQLANGTVATPTNGAWQVVATGTNDPYANEWYISATSSSGFGAGSCDDGCLNNPSLINRTLHISTISFCVTPADMGANYYEGACALFNPPPFTIYCASTDKRAESPLINCLGHSSIILSFDYIHQGALPLGLAGPDRAELMYFNGVTWQSLGLLPQTNNSVCAGTGLWTNYTVTLPASADNNPGIKIGYRWFNVDDGNGSDPSISVDNIKLIEDTSSFKVSLITNTYTLCSVDTLHAIANSTSSVSGYTWAAMPSNGVVFTSPSSSSTSILFPSNLMFPITYTITVIISNGTNTSSSYQLITVSPTPPIPTVSVNGATLTCNPSAATYQWYLNGSPISGATSQTYVATQTGYYSVWIGNSAGCQSSSSSVYVVVTGIQNAMLSGLVKITPNPASEYLTINSSVEKVLSFKITDALGKVVYINTIDFTKVKEQSIDISDLDAGVYIVELSDGQGKIVEKILKK